MSYKKFVIAFMSGFLAVFTVFAVINFWFDFHTAFRQEEDLVYKGVNDRYAKIAYLIKNPQKYEGYLFGSSRIKKTDTTMISKKTYNMGYDSGDGINEWLRDIKTLLQNNVNIKIDDVYKVNGTLSLDNKYDFIKNIIEKDICSILNKIDNVQNFVKSRHRGINEHFCDV